MARKKIPVRPQPPRPRPVGRKKKAAARSTKVKTVAPKKASKTKGHHTGSIIESNRKTEICMNWKKGACAFGARCAFAHGEDDLRLKTLKELEKEGRIPDASKHHARLCMVWVSTGACPRGIGCTTIHDPRVTGPVEATLRPPPQLEKISNTSSRTGSSKLLCAEGEDHDNPLHFPAIPRDPDSPEQPADKVRYDLDPSDASYAGGRNLSAVEQMWYSFMSAIIQLNVMTITGTPTATADTVSASNAASTSTLPRLEPSSPATTPRVSYKDAATRSLAARRTPAKKGGTTASADPAAARVAKTNRASSTAVVTAAAAGAPANRRVAPGTAAATPSATTTEAATAGAGAATSPLASPSRLACVEGLLEMEIPRPMHTVKHLPVFESLSKGETPARRETLQLPDNTPALGHGDASAGGADVDGVAPSPVPSSCSVYYSPTPSPSQGAAPPSPVGGIASGAAPGVVQLEGDSYFSCPSSPAWSTTVLKPSPDFEAAHLSTASGGWSATSTDAASWTSSGVSSERNDGDDRDDDVEGSGEFDFLQDLNEPLPDSWSRGAATGERRVPTARSRLPFFAGLHSDDIHTSINTNTTIASSYNNSPSTSTATNGDGGMIYLLLPAGGGGNSGGWGCSDGDYMTRLDLGGGSASGYGNGESFFRLHGPAPIAVAPSKSEYVSPVAQAEYHRQHPYAGAAKPNTRSVYATHFF